MRRLFLLSLLILPAFAFTQDHYQRLATIDIEHYRFALELHDQDNQIKGQAEIRFLLKQTGVDFYLDLVGGKGRNNGMQVKQVLWDGSAVPFNHQDNQLSIKVPDDKTTGEPYILKVDYEGIPEDGLIIGKSKYGKRTFFGDNWPNRARHWLPTVDHPSDKATVEFVITAPSRYQVIANGFQLEETNLDEDHKLTHWRTKVPLPTKVMVIGVAEFAVQQAGEIHGIPVSSWVYPQNREAGFYDYSQAVEVLDWFVDHIGPYPYLKLANVQSKTRYGGMENAGNIFYFENSVTGKREREALLAHEIAHQWFGNSASEASWHHVWLSEGFATYCTDLYMEHKYGAEKLQERMIEERSSVLRFAATRRTPIVDTTITDYNRVLNANSYQKGAWVLHMLRQKLGYDNFWTGLREYYRQYQYSNAYTKDLKNVMEAVSGQELDAFFEQWVFQPGFPELIIIWSYNAASKQVQLNIDQQQSEDFEFPLEIAFKNAAGVVIDTRKLEITERTHRFSFRLDAAPEQLEVDPNTHLLFTGRVVQE